MCQSSNSHVYLDHPIDVYDTFYKRAKGLMFKKKVMKDYGVLLIPCSSIHMFFMFQSIDVVFLNKEFYVLSAYEAFKPNSILSQKGAYAVLELPLNTIKKNRISIGDKIYFNEIRN